MSDPETQPGKAADPMEMDLNDLATLINNGPEEVPAEAPDDQPAEEAEPAEETEEPTEPERTEEQPRTPTEIEELRAEIEAVKARAKHFESVAGRNAGRVGYLERQLAERNAKPAEDYTEGERETERQGRDPYLTHVASSRAVERFGATYPDMAKDPSFLEALQPMLGEIENIRRSGDPEYIEAGIVRILEETRQRHVANQKEKFAAEVARKRADPAADLKARKKAQAAASSGTAKAAPKVRTVDPMTMPLKDLGNLINQRARS